MSVPVALSPGPRLAQPRARVPERLAALLPARGCLGAIGDHSMGWHLVVDFDRGTAAGKHAKTTAGRREERELDLTLTEAETDELGPLVDRAWREPPPPFLDAKGRPFPRPTSVTHTLVVVDGDDALVATGRLGPAQTALLDWLRRRIFER